LIINLSLNLSQSQTGKNFCVSENFARAGFLCNPPLRLIISEISLYINKLTPPVIQS